MEIELLGQGFESKSQNSVGNLLIKFFKDQEFYAFTGITAFASQSGVNGISHHINEAKKHLKNITIVTGIDKKGTSIEALEAILIMKIKSFIFYQPGSNIFHPKIYLFEGKSKSALIIGSSNLTSLGLFSNVETSLLVNIDNTIEADKNIVKQLKAYFSGIFDYSDPNLQKITKKLIVDLVNENLVPTEAERKAAYDKEDKAQRKENQKFISLIFPKRAIPIIPKEFRGNSTRKAVSKEGTTHSKLTINSKGAELVWQSGPLTERALVIPKGSNTHATGSMTFSKGKTEDIDQRSYFRDSVFSSLNWVRNPNSRFPHMERATAIFNIIIDGKNYGDFKLALKHDPRTDTKTYNQNNSMTSVSWGDAKNVIAKDELLGKSIKMFRKSDKVDEFILAIE